MSLLPAAPLVWAFVGASALLAFTPGPAVVYILTRTLAQGRAAGLASVAGVAVGNLGNALGAALGLAALFAVSSTAFTVVKWAGALYLIGLGVQQLRRRSAPDHAAKPAPATPSRLMRDGALVALLNPKTTLFFAAFLPQFMDAGASPAVQGAALGGLFVAIAGASDLGYVLLAGLLAPRLSTGTALRRWGPALSGCTFIALGVACAAGGQRSAVR